MANGRREIRSDGLMDGYGAVGGLVKMCNSRHLSGLQSVNMILHLVYREISRMVILPDCKKSAREI